MKTPAAWIVRTYYSLRFGVLSPERIIELAVSHGITHLVICDINNSTGFFDLLKAGQTLGIRVTPGIEIRNENQCLYYLLAENPAGFTGINRFVSECRLSEQPFPEKAPRIGHVVALYPAERAHLSGEEEYVAILPHETNKTKSSRMQAYASRMVFFPRVTFSDPSEQELHLHLRCIDNNCLLSLKPEIGNADAREYPGGIASFTDKETQQWAAYKRYETLTQGCSFPFEFRSNKNKDKFLESRQADREYLRSLCLQGMELRYGKNHAQALQRLDYELEVIEKLGFNSYFLITHDIVQYALHKGYYHVGRGSGANSLAAYCLRITDVDPIELDLYFERFLNPKRSSPPDFDLDFSWKERDDVLQYIFNKYTYEYTALLGTISTFRDSSPIRELGKVQGLPLSEIEYLAETPREQLVLNSHTESVMQLSDRLQSFPNHLSIHAGGVLISKEPMYAYGATHLPPKGFPTVQWDMYIAEDIGFEKFDILSQRGIGHIKDSVTLIRENLGQEIDIHDIPRFKEDVAVKKQLQLADTIGCFYIESPAMRQLLKKLSCSDYLTLVAASSIIRPGVSKSGMMKAYIERFHHPEAVEYLHPVMREQLSETYGVMVYQEDVLKVCHHFAGLDLADADVLRRAMSGKYRSKAEFNKITEKFFDNCRKMGHSDALSAEVWRQIESFAGYSFSKAHSASFAAESFQSLFLKTYFPKEFMVAVINNFGGFYRTWVYVTEAKKAGARVELPCVNNSRMHTRIQGNTIHLGFVHVESLQVRVTESILHARQTGGAFSTLEEFIDRTSVSAEQLQILIRCGALRFTGLRKEELLWQGYTYINRKGKQLPPEKLFQTGTKKFTLPPLENNLICDAYDEIELLGFPVTLNDFDLLRTSIREPLRAKDLGQFKGKEVRIMGLYVTRKPVRTSKGDMMNFGTFYDLDFSFFDTVHFPPSLREYPLTGRGVYLMSGKVSEEFGAYSIEVNKLAKLPVKEDPRNK